MKVTVLAENTACRADVKAQHGLSLYVETEDQKILFDMGQDDTFLQNARTLGIDLANVDLAILSHGHYDHGGGLETFLSVNAKAPVYVHAQAFGDYYNGTEKYIGLDQTLCHHPRLRFVSGETKLSSDLVLTDCNALGWVNDSWGLNRREGDAFFPDDFHHEQYLVVTEGNKKILISGCSHKGIVNIAGHFQPDVLIGGFHLNKLENARQLQRIGQMLLRGNTLYYTGHCTGQNQFAALKACMSSRLKNISTGLVFDA